MLPSVLFPYSGNCQRRAGKVVFDFCTVLLLLFTHAHAGCTMEEGELYRLRKQAALVVSGKILFSETLMQSGHLHTLHHFVVSTYEKGQGADTLLVLNPGGSNDTTVEVAWPAAQLPLGVPLTLYLEKVPATKGLYRCIGGPAGAEAWHTESQSPDKKAVTVPLIANLVPAVLVAGKNEKITLFGSGFGNTSAGGKVLFRDANKGGNSFTEILSSDYLSWSDTKIEVYLPDFAGTGPAQVVKNGSMGMGGSMQVLWAKGNYTSGGNAYPTYLYDKNSTGGYFFSCKGKLGEDSAAVSCIRNAIRSWRCSTLVNFSYAASGNTQTETVEYAPAGELASGVLGICYSTFSSCDGKDWSVSKLHIMFRDSIDWHTGQEPAGNTSYDLASVALHELGHALQLGHVIDPNDVMHYSIGRGVMRREPGSNNISGAAYNIGESAAAFCNLSGMRALQSNMCSDEEVSFFRFLDSRLFPNPSGGNVYLDLFSDVDMSGTLSVYDSKGSRIVFQNVFLKAGVNEYLLDTSAGMASGMYVVYVEAGGKLLKKKMTLLKP